MPVIAIGEGDALMLRIDGDDTAVADGDCSLMIDLGTSLGIAHGTFRGSQTRSQSPRDRETVSADLHLLYRDSEQAAHVLTFGGHGSVESTSAVRTVIRAHKVAIVST
jgi:hypothetical protein